MSELTPLVYIVTVNYNGWQDTLECLVSLEKLNYLNYRIVVVDNASVDDSESIIRHHFPDLTIIQSAKNLGYAGGNNIGIRHALDNKADYIWLLNNDTVVDPNALTYLIGRMKEKPSAGMCGSTLLYFHDRETVQALGGAKYNKWLGIQKHIGEGESASRLHNPENVETQLDYIVGASIMTSRSFVETIGLMNEDYFLYYEEIDWATRAKSMYTLAYAPQSVIYHKEGASIGMTRGHITKEKRLRSEYYSLRSRLMFTRRYFPEALLTVYFGIMLMLIVRLARGQWSRVANLVQVLWLLVSKSPVKL